MSANATVRFGPTHGRLGIRRCAQRRRGPRAGRTDNGRRDAGLGSHPARAGKKAVVEAAPMAQALAAVVKEHPWRKDELQIHGALHG